MKIVKLENIKTNKALLKFCNDMGTPNSVLSEGTTVAEKKMAVERFLNKRAKKFFVTAANEDNDVTVAGTIAATTTHTNAATLSPAAIGKRKRSDYDVDSNYDDDNDNDSNQKPSSKCGLFECK